MKKTKEKVIDILMNNTDKYISGENISESLGISRASIWKHINSLKKEGFVIESKTGLGYKLSSKHNSDFFPYTVNRNLNTLYMGQDIVYFESIDSTNIYANKIASNSSEGTVIISDEQTSGKGRTGKKWHSEKNVGLYFSIILKPNVPIIKAGFLTQVAGASVVSVLEDMQIEASIKWPNDIIINGKKIAGILTEMSAEIDRISYIVVGIGINLYNDSFNEEISNIAGSLLKEGKEIDKTEFLKRFFVSFEGLYEKYKDDDNFDALEIIRNKSAVIDKEIYLLKNDTKIPVVAKTIDSFGNLIVEYPDGKRETVFTGEISIRGLDSYI